MSLEIPIQIKTGTDSQRAGATIGDREPHITTDLNEFWVGGNHVYLHTGESPAPSAAGTTTLTIASNRRQHMVEVTAAAGSGSYTHKIVLPNTNRRGWDACMICVHMPASANPTVSFHSGVNTNPSLKTLTGDAGGARDYFLVFSFVTSAWKLFFSNQTL